MKASFADYLVATGRVTPDRLELIPRSEWLHREPMGRLAMLHGLLSGVDVEEVLRHQRTNGQRFGEVAIRMGMITREQLEVLFRGQSLRACLELVEDLALAGILDFTTGLVAATEFISSFDLSSELSGSVAVNV
jgi:hypothetical protein